MLCNFCCAILWAWKTRAWGQEAAGDRWACASKKCQKLHDAMIWEIQISEATSHRPLLRWFGVSHNFHVKLQKSNRSNRLFPARVVGYFHHFEIFCDIPKRIDRGKTRNPNLVDQCWFSLWFSHSFQNPQGAPRTSCRCFGDPGERFISRVGRVVPRLKQALTALDATAVRRLWWDFDVSWCGLDDNLREPMTCCVLPTELVVYCQCDSWWDSQIE